MTTAGYSYRLHPGLVRFVAGDAYLIEGGPIREAFTGPGAVDVLPELCELLDGRHLVSEIAARLRIPPADAAAGIALLASRGLIHRTRPDAGPTAGPASPAAAFFARTVGHTGRATAAEEIMTNLGLVEVLVAGVEPVRSTIETELGRSGVTARPYDRDLLDKLPPVVGAGRPAAIVVEAGTSGVLSETLRAGHLWLGVNAGATSGSVGPLLHPGTSCPCQLDRQPDPPAAASTGPAAPEVVALIAAVAAGEVVHGLGGGADVATVARSIEVVCEPGQPPRTAVRRHTRRHGCPDCGVESAVGAGEPDRGQLAWEYEQAIAVPPPVFRSRSEALRTLDTLALQRRQRALLTCPAVGGDEVPDDDPLAAVTRLLGRTVGMTLGDPTERPRRQNSTAGNLGSPQAFVVSRRELPGLGSHCAWYDGAADRLVATGRVDRDELASTLTGELDPTRWEHLVVWVAELQSTAAKYGNLALRLVHLDAGVALGQAFLVAAAHGLNPRLLTHWDAASFAGLLDLDLEYELVTSVMVFGGDNDG